VTSYADASYHYGGGWRYHYDRMLERSRTEREPPAQTEEGDNHIRHSNTGPTRGPGNREADPSPQKPAGETVAGMSEYEMEVLNARLTRALDDISEIKSDLKAVLAWRWTLTGAISLISFFGLSICGFTGWSLWSDNERLVSVEAELKLSQDFPLWKAKTDQRIEALEEQNIKRGK
jgi:hypothetical protein